jgi:hypothetical protein
MKHARTVLTAMPLIAVNVTAFRGQIAFLREHLSWPVPGDVMFAASLESVACFWHTWLTRR